MRTPTAVCALRGSGIGVTADSEQTEVACYEDKAYVKGIKEDGSYTEETTIAKGLKSTIQKFMIPGELFELSVLELERWTDVTKQLTQHLENFSKNFASGSEFVTKIGMDAPQKILSGFNGFGGSKKEATEEQELDEEEAQVQEEKKSFGLF